MLDSEHKNSKKSCCQLVENNVGKSDAGIVRVDWLNREVGWWERYPYDGGTAAAGKRTNSILFEAPSDYENHFLRECSNAGICNRKTGICECYDGFTGSSCNDVTCVVNKINGLLCSGHGRCMKSADMDALSNGFNGGHSFSLKLERDVFAILVGSALIVRYVHAQLEMIRKQMVKQMKYKYCIWMITYIQ